MYRLQNNKKKFLLSLLFILPLYSMQNNTHSELENSLESQLFIAAHTNVPTINNTYINSINNNGFCVVTSKSNKKKSSSNQVPTKLSNPPVKNKYPKIFEAYCNFFMKDMGHVIERHYDPRGKKMDQGDNKLIHKPYEGYVNNRYTTFFPRSCKVATIYACINELLANPYIVHPSLQFKNALVVKGRFKKGVTTEVIVAYNKSGWRVKTAYPKFQKKINN